MTEIAILGVGARTPLGYDRESSAAAVRAGISVIEEHPFMIDRFGMPMKVTRDAALPPDLFGPDRLLALAEPAARAGLAPLAGVEGAGPVAVVFSTGEARPGQEAGTDAELAGRLRGALQGAARLDPVGHSMSGHAGGILAFEAARRLLAEGRAEFVLAGGVDSYLCPDTLEWLDETEQLHSDENIYGFCPGEAAGFVLLARAEAARRLGLAPALWLLSAGTAREDNLIKTDDICLGEGLAAAFTAAATPLQEGEAVDRILCDMNGERYRGNEYGFAALRVPGLFRDAADFEAPADCWGDVGAASAPLHAALVAEAGARGYAPGPLSLLWAGSEAGLRGAAILRGPGGDA